MAIIIPSSKIFNIDRPLVLKNKVDKVGVDTNIVTKNNDYRKNIETIKRDIEISELKIYEDSDRQTYTYNTHGEEFTAVAYVSAKIGFFNISISISETIKNGIINEIYDGLDKNNNANIPYTLYYKDKNGELLSGVLSDGLPITVSATVTGPTTASVTLPDYTDNTKQQWSYNGGVFSINLKILAYKKTTKSEKTISGTKTDEQEYTPEKVEITIYGDTIGIDLTNETFEFGEGENPLAISGNELLQDGTTTKGDTTSEFIADNILNQYSNGKEKATLRCAIGNYFDENGEKKISIDNDNLPMEFSVGDEVIPKVYIGNNEEKFMSSKYGKPKKYEVASVKPYFDGACWQEIEIIEKNL